MSFLSDFPLLRLGDGRHVPPSNGFAEEVWSPPDNAVPAAREMTDAASAVLVMAPHVGPNAKAASLWIEPEILAAGLALGFPARSQVTGLFVDHGATLIPAPLLKQVETLPVAALTFPYAAGILTGNETPETAFGQGYLSVLEAECGTAAARSRLALAASLGTEALNGDWWVLGALSGLRQGTTLAGEWSRHEHLLETPASMPRQLSVEARHVRQTTGLPVQTLSHGESRALKAMLPDWPSSDIWTRFIRDCEHQPPPVQRFGTEMARAAGRLWAHMNTP